MQAIQPYINFFTEKATAFAGFLKDSATTCANTLPNEIGNPIDWTKKQVDILTSKDNIPNEMLGLLVNKTIKATPFIAAFYLFSSVTFPLYLAYTVCHLVNGSHL